MSAQAELINAVPAWFDKFLSRGFRLIPYLPGEKGPSGADAKGWPARAIASHDGYIPGRNYGVLLGAEIAPGKFLVDVDFDWGPGVPLTKRILPATGFGFGRPSKSVSHAFYTAPVRIQSRQFKDIDGSVLVELRGAKADESLGLQTMLPPSVHPSGEVLELRIDEEIAHVENIERSVGLYAIACLLLRHLGERGFGHEVRLAFAGYSLKKCRLSEDETVTIGEALAEATSNDVRDVRETIRSTAARLKQGDRATGATALAEAMGENGRRVLDRIQQWLDAGEFVCNPRTGVPVADHYENLQRALERLGVRLSFDVFAQEVRVTWKERAGILDDAFRNCVWFAIEREFHFRPSAGYFDTFLQDLAQQHRFHPVQDYLDALRWDGIPRIDSWLTTFGAAADNAYTRAVGKLVLVAAVRRVRQPGCKFDEMMVLEGEQGGSKSSALRILCPNEDWFSDDLPLNVDAKQIIERTLGKWIIEASDLHGYGAADVEHLKSTLSRGVDGPVRLAYARMPTQRPRHFVIVGTTNSHVYLKDATGNRRFWPVRVERLDVEGLRSVRDQLWAEAAKRAADGESIRLDPRLYPLAALQQERRRQMDPWESSLDEAFPEKHQRLTWNDIYTAVGISVDRRDPRAHGRLVKILQGLGFRSMSVKRDGRVGRGMGRDSDQLGFTDDSAPRA